MVIQKPNLHSGRGKRLGVSLCFPPPPIAASSEATEREGMVGEKVRGKGLLTLMVLL